MHNGLQVKLLCGDQWKSSTEVKTHLMTKNGTRPGPRSVAFISSSGLSQEIVIRLHGIKCILRLKNAFQAKDLHG